jgi:hypothetical protein
MIVTVVVINLVISLVCLFVAQKIWQLRRRLAQVTAALQRIEHNTHQILHPAPLAITNGQIGTRNLRIRYQRLSAQWQKLQQLVVLLSRFQNPTEFRRFRKRFSTQRSLEAKKNL